MFDFKLHYEALHKKNKQTKHYLPQNLWEYFVQHVPQLLSLQRPKQHWASNYNSKHLGKRQQENRYHRNQSAKRLPVINYRNNRIQSCSYGPQFTVTNGMCIACKLHLDYENQIS